MTSPGTDETVPAGAESGTPAGAEPETPAGAEPPAAPPSGPRRPLTNAQRIAVAAAVGVAAVGIGGGVVYASSHQSSNGQFGNGGMRIFRPGGGSGLTDALHGEYVASNGKNGTRTMLIQTGTVTAVSSSSVSVRSTDGFAGTYVVGSGTKVDDGATTIGKVKTGHTVTVVATKSDRTATSILDTTLLGGSNGGPQNNTGPQGGTGQQGGAPRGGQPGNGGPGGQP